MSIITLTEAQRAIRYTGTLSANDSLTLTDMVNALTPALEREAGPIVLATKTFSLRSWRKWYIVLPSAYASITSVVCDGTTLTPVTDYDVINADRGILQAPPWYRPRWSYSIDTTVTYVVGSATISDNVREAAMELVRYWWQIGQQGGAPSPGQQYSAGPSMSGGLLPDRVMSLLGATPNVGGFA